MSLSSEELQARRDAFYEYISKHPEGIPQNTLWKEIGVDSRTCSRVVTELLEAGRVTREKITATYLIRAVVPSQNANSKLLMAGESIIPCVTCTEECDVSSCKLLEDWIYELVFSEIE